MGSISFKISVLILLIGSTISTGFGQHHLLLSEVALQPAEAEFIEIFNPTDTTIYLTNYYLADNMKYADYHAAPGSLDAGDFIVRFPAGTSIAANTVATIAFNGTNFNTSYSKIPDYEIISSNASYPDMISIVSSSTPSLTNAGECIILFYWDGTTDLVKDVDLMNAGIPATSNKITPKNSLSIDGPDADALKTSYLTDIGTIPFQIASPAAYNSTKRIRLETNEETMTGGNGITGDDETSENILKTWDTGFTAANPGISGLVKTTNVVNQSLGNFKLFPNPFGDFIHITNATVDNYFVEIQNVCGNLVAKTAFTQNTILNTRQFCAGIYTYKIYKNSEPILHGKLIKN